MKEMNDNKYVHIGTHLYADQEGNTTNRVKFTLFNKNNRFVDAFDFNVDNNNIRFYGSHKEYDLNNIPKYKKKLWNNYFDVFRQVEE